MDWLTWYNGLVKPSWTPAPATIGLIWQILYPVILVTFGFVFVQMFRGKIGWKSALPFAVNLLANLIFTPIQFGLRNLPLAAVDILIVWGTIIWMSVAIWKHYRWVSLAQIPYFVWVSIATVLQLSITAMNWGRSLTPKMLTARPPMAMLECHELLNGLAWAGGCGLLMGDRTHFVARVEVSLLLV